MQSFFNLEMEGKKVEEMIAKQDLIDFSFLSDNNIPANRNFSGEFDGSSLDLMEYFRVEDSFPPIYSGFLASADSTQFQTPIEPVSSSSTETAIDEQVEVGEEVAEEKKKTIKKKNNKGKKKRQREQRVAFVTKSDVDNLEDGFRWRKYGQKAVKNSPFPRSYYRCTAVQCGVKKRVERSCRDSTVVVTTYEGQHTHPCPDMPRQSLLSVSRGYGEFGSSLQPGQMQINYNKEEEEEKRRLLPYLHSVQASDPPQMNPFSSSSSPSEFYFSEQHELVIRDQGLLQDIIPSNIKKLG